MCVYELKYLAFERLNGFIKARAFHDENHFTLNKKILDSTNPALGTKTGFENITPSVAFYTVNANG